MSKQELVVKSNKLNSAIQNLTLTEIRIIQLAIIDARETNTGLSTDKPLRIEARRYSEAFNVTIPTAREAILSAEETLFNRRFSYTNDKGLPVKSRWIQEVTYMKGEGAIEIAFTRAVVEGISRIDGAVDFFTEYLLKQTSTMKSGYSVRLYELLIQWKAAVNTPVFELQQFRKQLGIEETEYKNMCDFKKGVLTLALTEINKKSDIKVVMKQHKKGRNISGFSFTVKSKAVVKPKVDKPVDPFINWTDKQISFFSSELSRLPEYSDKVKGGASYEDLAKVIALELKDKDKQKTYYKSLEALGYKAA